MNAFYQQHSQKAGCGLVAQSTCSLDGNNRAYSLLAARLNDSVPCKQLQETLSTLTSLLLLLIEDNNFSKIRDEIIIAKNSKYQIVFTWFRNFKEKLKISTHQFKDFVKSLKFCTRQ